MAFDAGDFDTVFDYDLKQWGGKGHVPDPTMPEARQFRDDISAALKGIDPEEGDVGGVELVADLSTQIKERFAERDEKADALLEVVIAFCKGSPSRETLTNPEMPGLIRAAFVNWLVDAVGPLF